MSQTKPLRRDTSITSEVVRSVKEGHVARLEGAQCRETGQASRCRAPDGVAIGGTSASRPWRGDHLVEHAAMHVVERSRMNPAGRWPWSERRR